MVVFVMTLFVDRATRILGGPQGLGQYRPRAAHKGLSREGPAHKVPGGPHKGGPPGPRGGRTGAGGPTRAQWGSARAQGGPQRPREAHTGPRPTWAQGGPQGPREAPKDLYIFMHILDAL